MSTNSRGILKKTVNKISNGTVYDYKYGYKYGYKYNINI